MVKVRARYFTTLRELAEPLKRE